MATWLDVVVTETEETATELSQQASLALFNSSVVSETHSVGLLPNAIDKAHRVFFQDSFDFNVAAFTSVRGTLSAPYAYISILDAPFTPTQNSEFLFVVRKTSSADSDVLFQVRAHFSITVKSLLADYISGGANNRYMVGDYDFSAIVSVENINGENISLSSTQSMSVSYLSDASISYEAAIDPNEDGYIINKNKNPDGISSYVFTHRTFGVIPYDGLFDSIQDFLSEQVSVTPAGFVSANPYLVARLSGFFIKTDFPDNAFLTVTKTRSQASTVNRTNGGVTLDRLNVPATKIGSFRDVTDAIFTAVKDSSDIQIYSTRTTAAQKQTLAKILGAKSPSIFKDSAQRLWLFAQKTSGGAWRMWKSDKNGATGTFSEVGVEAFGSTYSKAAATKIQSGIAVIAIETATKKLWFRKSLDNGATWKTAVLITTLTTSEQFEIEQKIDGTLSVHTGKLDKKWKSKNDGQTWTAD